MKKIMALVMTMALTGAIFAGLSDVSLQGTAPRERACPHNKQELTAAAAAETAEEAIEETVPAEQTNEVTEDAVEAAPVEDVVDEDAAPIEDIVEEIAPIDEMDVVEGAPLAENMEITKEIVDAETVDTTYPVIPANWGGWTPGGRGSDWISGVLAFNRGELERNHWVYRKYNYRALSEAEYNEVKAIRHKIVTVDPNFVINNAKYDKQGNWVSETRSPDNWK